MAGEFDELLAPPDTLESMDFGSQPGDAAILKEIEQEDQDRAFSRFDMPIPGQSLTAEPGGAAYEQPPQYNDVDEVVDMIFDRMLRPEIQTDVLHMLAAQVPARSIAEVVLMHGS